MLFSCWLGLILQFVEYLMAEKLAEKGWLPDLTLSSSSMQAESTLYPTTLYCLFSLMMGHVHKLAGSREAGREGLAAGPHCQQRFYADQADIGHNGRGSPSLQPSGHAVPGQPVHRGSAGWADPKAPTGDHSFRSDRMPTAGCSDVSLRRMYRERGHARYLAKLQQVCLPQSCATWPVSYKQA